MKQLTFKKQLIFGITIIIIGFICSTVFKSGIFSNIAWVLYGLMFAIYPLCPEGVNNEKRVKLIMRIAGVVIMIVGLSTRFGV